MGDFLFSAYFLLYLKNNTKQNFFFFFGLFAFSGAAHAAYGGSQVRGPIGESAMYTTAHSNARSLTH